MLYKAGNLLPAGKISEKTINQQVQQDNYKLSCIQFIG
jgi:hypothetical protein